MKFKQPDVSTGDLESMTAITFLMLGSVVAYCSATNIPCTVTSLIGPDLKIRKSKTHSSGRAFDISIKDMTHKEAIEMRDFFNDKFYDVAAISSRTGEPVACVYHDGTAMHLHFQSKPMKYIKREVLERMVGL